MIEIILDWVVSIVIAISVAFMEFVLEPFQNPYSLTDESIGFPHKLENTVSDVVLFLWAVGLPIITVIGYNIVASKFSSNYNKSISSSDMKIGCIMAIQVFVYTALFTDFIKLTVGSLRPDFLARCVKDQIDRGVIASESEWDGSCSNEKIVLQGRKSFPSGHASLALCAGLTVCFYLWAKLGIGQRGKRTAAWKMALVILPVLISLYSGISRLQDKRHRASDVVAGDLLALVITFIVYHYHYPPFWSSSSERSIPYALLDASVATPLSQVDEKDSSV